MLVMLSTTNYIVSFIFLLLAFLTAEMWLGPGLAMMQDMAPPVLRSMFTAVFFAAVSLGSVGPFFVGLLNDTLAIKAPYESEGTTQGINKSKVMIGYDPTISLYIFVPGFYAISAVCFVYAAYLLKKQSTP